jgi:hypothetical protein
VQSRFDFVENPLILLARFRALASEQSWNGKLWNAQLAEFTFIVEAGHADVKRCHSDLSVGRRRRAEKIDRADNFLQQALPIAFPDFDRVVHCISREISIW